MHITCPDCKGERRVYIPKPVPLVPITNKPGSTSVADFSYERELIDCPLCKGTGRAEATGRVPVFRDGGIVGTVPSTFDPNNIKSNSFWYTPRAGDFKRDGDIWVARSELGPGDLEAVQGFSRINR